MENIKKKNLKNNSGIKDKSQKDNNINCQMPTILKLNWDKLESEYDSLIKQSEKYLEFFKDSKIKYEYKSLILSFVSFKNNLKKFILNIGENLSKTPEFNIKTNNNHKKIALPYENIYNDMTDIESLIKDIYNIQNNIKKKRNIKIQTLENTLHEYMDEIEKLDFNKIEKVYDIYNNYNKNDIEKILLKNNFIEKYNDKKYNYNNDNFDDNTENNNLFKINSLTNDSDNK